MLIQAMNEKVMKFLYSNQSWLRKASEQKITWGKSRGQIATKDRQISKLLLDKVC